MAERWDCSQFLTLHVNGTDGSQGLDFNRQCATQETCPARFVLKNALKMPYLGHIQPMRYPLRYG